MPGSYPTAFRVIAMPYEVGRLRDGVGRGPEHLLEHGAAEALASGGASVSVELVELDTLEDNEVDTSFELMRRVSQRVAAAVDDGAFPVILSGSCFAAVGVVGGSASGCRTSPGSTPTATSTTPRRRSSTTSMGWAARSSPAAPGRGFTRRCRGRALPESSLVLAGARAFDAPEEERLRRSDVKQVEVSGLVETLGGLSLGGLYLHVDLDVLDEKVNVYTAPGGPGADELLATTREILDGFPVVAMSLTAYDPACDPENRIPPIATNLLQALASAT